jgi:hypothetical protein
LGGGSIPPGLDEDPTVIVVAPLAASKNNGPTKS